PLAFALARVRVWAVRHRRPGPACWLLLRRPLEPDAEVKSYLSNAAADAPLETRALVTATRYRVEGYLGEGNSYLGTAQYEARAWSRWHHPMSMVALAHRFVTLTRRRLKKDSRADLGPGPALAPERVGLPEVHGRGSAGPQGVPPAAEPDRSKSPHEVMASTTHQGAIQSAAVKGTLRQENRCVWHGCCQSTWAVPARSRGAVRPSTRPCGSRRCRDGAWFGG